MKKFSMYIFSENKGILLSVHCIFVLEIFTYLKERKNMQNLYCIFYLEPFLRNA